MIRLSKLTDYAMLIMSQMAKEHGNTLSASTLANTLKLTVPTVSKILKILCEAGLVASVRGAEGGYHLTSPPFTITLADIITAMEGAPALTECCNNNLCVIDSMCTLKDNWRKINEIVLSLFNRLTLVDMLKPLSLERLHVK